MARALQAQTGSVPLWRQVLAPLCCFTTQPPTTATWRRKRNKRPHRNIAGGTDELKGWKNWEYGTFKHHFQPERGDSDRRSYSQHDEGTDDVLQNDDWLWKHLTRSEIASAIATLQEHASDERIARFDQVLSTRTQFVRLVYENPANANNVWAALRTLDAFGLQYVDVILDPEKYKKGCPRRRTMVSAMGAQKWLSLEQHHETHMCIETLRPNPSPSPSPSPNPNPNPDRKG